MLVHNSTAATVATRTECSPCSHYRRADFQKASSSFCCAPSLHAKEGPEEAAKNCFVWVSPDHRESPDNPCTSTLCTQVLASQSRLPSGPQHGAVIHALLITQALGHDPVRLGTPLGIWGGYAKDQHARSVTRSPTRRAGSISKFGVCSGLHPRLHWALDVREGQSGRKDVRGGYFGAPPPAVTGFQVTLGCFCPQTGRSRTRASRCRGLQVWDCGVEVKS